MSGPPTVMPISDTFYTGKCTEYFSDSQLPFFNRVLESRLTESTFHFKFIFAYETFLGISSIDSLSIYSQQKQ